MSKELRQMMDEEHEAGIKEGMKKGIKEGKREGMIEAFVSMVKEGLMHMKDATKRLGMLERELTKLAGLY